MFLFHFWHFSFILIDVFTCWQMASFILHSFLGTYKLENGSLMFAWSVLYRRMRRKKWSRIFQRKACYVQICCSNCVRFFAPEKLCIDYMKLIWSHLFICDTGVWNAVSGEPPTILHLNRAIFWLCCSYYLEVNFELNIWSLSSGCWISILRCSLLKAGEIIKKAAVTSRDEHYIKHIRWLERGEILLISFYKADRSEPSLRLGFVEQQWNWRVGAQLARVWCTTFPFFRVCSSWAPEDGTYISWSYIIDCNTRLIRELQKKRTVRIFPPDTFHFL